MNLLKTVITGKIEKPRLILVYGPDGVGKSTLAAQSPKPIFLGTEHGTDQLDVTRFPQPKAWADVIDCIKALYVEEHDYQTLVIDSLDWLEPLIHKEICSRYQVNSIEKAAQGYGKGYIEAQTEWERLISGLNVLRTSKSMNIVAIGHSDITTFEDPSSQNTYNRYQLKLHKRSSALWREYVDAVLFANFDVYTSKDGQKTRTMGEGKRVLFTERRPGYDAKNRFSLPPMISMSWSELEENIAIAKAEDAENIFTSILSLAENLTEESTKKKVIEFTNKAKGQAKDLMRIKMRLEKRLQGDLK